MVPGVVGPEVVSEGAGAGGAEVVAPAVGEDPVPDVVAVDGDVVVVDVGVVVVAEQAALVGVRRGPACPATVSGVVAFALARGEVAAGVDAPTVVGVQRPPAWPGERALGTADVEDFALGPKMTRVTWESHINRSSSRRVITTPVSWSTGGAIPRVSYVARTVS